MKWTASFSASLLFGSVFALSLGCQNKSTSERESSGGPEASSAEGSRSPAAGSVTAANSATAALVGTAASAGTAAGQLPAPATAKSKLNVILLTIDSMRADMPWAGYPKPIAPNLTKFAEKAVAYTQFRSVSSYTAQTISTLMSGRYASTLYRTGVFFTNYGEDNVWMPELMQAQGISTLGVQAHLYFERSSGLRQGFDTWKMVPGLIWNAQTDENITSEKSANAILELLAQPERQEKQFFLWSHLMDPHDQYMKHSEAPDFGKDNRARYDSELWYTDFYLGKVLAFIEQQAWAKNTAIIVSADHGEAFGEHGMHRHAFELWDVLTRIPLLVYVPGNAAAKIDVGRTNIDLAPTILDMLGMAPAESAFGKSMLPEILGQQKPESREPLLLELAEDTNNPARRAIISKGDKLIELDGGRQKLLFNLAQDPGELHDQAAERPERVEELHQQLTKSFAALPVVEPFGGNKLKSGKLANGPRGAAKAK